MDTSLSVNKLHLIKVNKIWFVHTIGVIPLKHSTSHPVSYENVTKINPPLILTVLGI